MEQIREIIRRLKVEPDSRILLIRDNLSTQARELEEVLNKHVHVHTYYLDHNVHYPEYTAYGGKRYLPPDLAPAIRNHDIILAEATMNKTTHAYLRRASKNLSEHTIAIYDKGLDLLQRKPRKWPGKKEQIAYKQSRVA